MTIVDSRVGNEGYFEAPVTDEQLAERFSPERLHNLCAEFIEDGPHGNLSEVIMGRPYIVGFVDATDQRFRDLGKSVETTRFAQAFKRSPSDVYNEYKETDHNATFAVALDVSDPDLMRPVGAARLLVGSSLEDMKDMYHVTMDNSDPEMNPWRQEVESLLFTEGEEYSQDEAWRRLQARAGVDLDPADSVDVATIAVDKDYAGKRGDEDSVSMRLYHEVLRFALANGKKNLVSIQDLKPFQNLQQFGEPFSTFEGLSPHPFGGPYDTIPAYAVLSEGMERIRRFDKGVGEYFIDGAGMQYDTLLPEEIDPSKYSNEAAGLPPVA